MPPHLGGEQGANVCTHHRTVRLLTSMPRSASSSITLAAERGWLSDHRTASRITSAGQRYPANAEAERAVKSRPQGRQA